MKPINVTAFPGVDLTGGLDSTRGIRAAIAYAHALSAEGAQAQLYLPTGTYRMGAYPYFANKADHGVPLNPIHVAVSDIYSDSKSDQVSSFSKPVYNRSLVLS